MRAVQSLYAACSASAGGMRAEPPCPPGNPPKQPTLEPAAFLLAIGYVARTGDGCLTVTDVDRVANRSALLGLSARVERLFRLQSSMATAAVFIGCRMAPPCLPTTADNRGPIDAGGRGTTLRDAFEGCLGEAAERLAVRAAGPVSAAAGSNGCAAGADLREARLRATLEAIERDALMLWWYGGRRAPALKLSCEDTLALRQFIESLRLEGGRRLWFLDLTSDIAVPVVAALSCQPDGSEVLVGSAADIEPAAAARSALLEMCQMHLAAELAGRDHAHSLPQTEGARPPATALHVDRFPALAPCDGIEQPRTIGPISGDPLEVIAERLAVMGLAVDWHDLTIESVGIPAVRVLVDGLQSTRLTPPTRRLLDSASRNGVSSERWHSMPPII